MDPRILVLNSGSSSVKYRLFERQPSGHLMVLISGRVERIGEEGAQARDHQAAIDLLVAELERGGYLPPQGLITIGHRVVHGGEAFHQAARITPKVLEAINAATPLAPLHNPPNLLGINACLKRWPELPQVAVFDTAFHQTLSASAFRYAIPDEAYRRYGIRRYGFHGTSFASVTHQVAAFLDRPKERLNLIVLHLGNGASACAIQGGRSIDTSMGMTPLAGLVMGTRSGDLDPGSIFYWMEHAHLSLKEMDHLLNQASGLKGIAGTNDMRDILLRTGEGDVAAHLALDIYVHRLRHYIGAYRAALPELDALVFTGGVGEHAVSVRSMACRELDHLGIVLDEARNKSPRGGILNIHAASSDVPIMVVPTDEEGEIARQALNEVLGSSI
ncbi:MAG: acetate kinase [Gammaproteobacteria bacterium]|nr:acetate kinase [Gammaproteobacteria bacterium]NBT43957.1 acetate kinase [Gammaproteobacteria bacterium]NBY23711.1 acetate kinase [Gammaproteobacteria bacterium]NDE33307.1 acetate kinase [Gammaproteobacteria bacterium]NDE55325.1 acetate kinase [Gammaproteobacteria bacterium]